MKKGIFLVVVLIGLIIHPLLPDQEAVYASPSVKISQSASVTLLNVNLIPGDQHQVLSYDLKYTNKGSRPLNLLDYWLKVVSDRGDIYSVQIHPEDKMYTAVAPGNSVTIRYFSKVGNDLKLSDLNIRVVEFDTSLPDYERIIDTISLTDSMSVTKANNSRLFELKGTPVYSRVKEYNAYEGSANAESAFDGIFVLFNNGRRAISTPDYRLMLMTANGLVYPLETTSEDEGTTIYPKSYKTYLFSGTLPAGISVKGAKLLLVQEVETSNGKIEMAAGTYELVSGTGTEAGESDATTELLAKLQDAEYKLTVNRIGQSPWDIQDIIAVELKITNLEDAIAPIPKLTGSIKLDNGTWIQLTSVANENESELLPESSTSIFMVGKIPSNAIYQTASILVKEQVSETQTRTIGQLKANRQLTPILSANETWSTKTYGLHTSYQIVRSGVYQGVYDDLYLAQVAIRNDDYRARELTSIVGFFRTHDGKLFRADVSEIEGVQSAGKSRIVNLWATIPKDLDTRNMQLILGEAVSQGKLAAKGEEANALINPVRFRLAEEFGVPVTARGIEVAPFTLNIHQFRSVYDLSNAGANELTIRLDYELVKNIQYLNDTEDRKFAIAIAYDGGKTTFEQTLDIDTEGDSTGNALQPGKHEITLSKSFPKEFLLHFYNDLELYIYEEFKGYKKLIAKKPFVLYNYHDWSNE